MKLIEVEIKGVTPLMQHRFPEDVLFGLLGVKTEKKKGHYGPFTDIRKNQNVINAGLLQNIKNNLMFIILTVILAITNILI